jgi:copper(I)-binding protein
MRRVFILSAMLGLLSALPAQAADVTVGTLTISAPWTRATPKGASVGAGYMTITNAGTASDRLIGGASTVSDRFEIHDMAMEGSVMKMHAKSAGLEIKPGATVTLQPGGLHVMFVGLKAPLTRGQTVKVTLQFEKAGKVEVDYPVAAIGAQSAGGGTSGTMPAMGGMKH